MMKKFPNKIGTDLGMLTKKAEIYVPIKSQITLKKFARKLK
ncbi:hypothetical protein QJL52_11560 [Clostridioides difficile]|nr:hypothetical protein [Clostridioides difficile]